MSFPATLRELEGAGYERANYGVCKGCGDAIEWWTTPNGQRIPMNFMRDEDSPAISHFATCPKVTQFKKEPHRCTPIYPTSTSPDLQQSLFSPEPSSSPEQLNTDKRDDKNESESKN